MWHLRFRHVNVAAKREFHSRIPASTVNAAHLILNFKLISCIKMASAMRDHLILYVNGRRHEVRGAQAFRSLSEFLRSDCQLTGTKVVCAEGDCGSCTVLIGRARNGKIEYQPVTSCIQYLAQLDATHVVTVEGLLYD